MDFCLDYNVLKQQILEDLKQLILIEKLFGEVPVTVLRYASGCRSKDVFTSALNLDKLIANAFGGQIPKDYYCQR